MKLSTNYIIGLLVLVLVSQSCKKTFTAKNTDPNSLNDAPPELLFSGGTLDVDDATRTQVIARYSFMNYMQYIVYDATPSISKLYTSMSSVTGPDPGITYYIDYFSGYTTDGINVPGTGVAMNRIIAKIDGLPAAQQATYMDLRAICQILNVFHAWRVTDIYGAMPYSQAFQPDKYPTPAYDFDYTLYKTYDSTLKNAAAVLQGAPAGQVNLGKQDFFYGGDIPSWLAFANTLRIKIAQRYEKRDAANLAAVLSDIQNNFKGALISGNAQSFGVNHSQNYNNNVSDINQIETTFDAAYPFVEFLKSTRDPRLALMVRQNDFGTNSPVFNTVVAGGDPTATAFIAANASQPYNGRYWGKHTFPAAQDATYGLFGGIRFVPLNVGASASANVDYISLIQGRYYVKNGGFGAGDPLLHTDETIVDGNTIPMRTLWLTYGETCFMMAEIAQKNGGTAMGRAASDWYNAGVTASFDQYIAAAKALGVPRADTITMGDYLIRYPYNNTLDRIYSQAWVHFLFQPEDAYAMWKRTGYPHSVDFRPGMPTPIGDGTGTAYLESLFDGSQNLLVPRRAQLTLQNAGSDLNSSNLYNAISTMQAKNPNYGASGVDTKGRIWWDN